LEFYAKDKKMMTSCFSGWNCLMFRIIAGNCLIDLKLLWIFIQCLIMIIAQEWKQTDHRLIILLTKKNSSFILGFLNPLSPSSEKNRRQRLKMSLEAKEAAREKEKFAIQRRRDLETKEQTALAKDKHREKKRLAMKRKREAETEEEKNGRGKKISLRRQDTIRP